MSEMLLPEFMIFPEPAPEIPSTTNSQQRGGFTFKGIHSSLFGIKETPSNKVLFPLKRRNLITIPGRSTAVFEEDGGYEPRVESIICSYGAAPGVNIHEQVRQIAGWLTGIGELSFDYEPELYYTAFVSSSPPLVTVLEGSQFQIEFTINPPFALEPAKQLNLLFAGAPSNVHIFEVDGTVKTPVRLIIRNDSPGRTLTDLKISLIYME